MSSSDPTARPRFYKALVAYAVLGTLAWTTLTEIGVGSSSSFWPVSP